MANAVPSVGMTMKVYGAVGTIIAVHAFGTVDVEMADGRCYRVTGLAF
jgi:hypothetical protein